jgi:predicted patatin/cPLA2 family phospholipase
MRNVLDKASSEGTALVVQGGGLRGAYAVGVFKTLYENYGNRCFEKIFAVSSGVFASSYYVAGQVDHMENTWRDLVHSDQLVEYQNFVTNQPVLKLDRLIDLFKGPIRLDTNAIKDSETEILYTLTHYETGEAEYLSSKRSPIFKSMKASSALPIVYPLPVFVNNKPYYDGGRSDPIPIEKAVSHGYSNILVIMTRPIDYRKEKMSSLMRYMHVGFRKQSRKSLESIHHKYNKSIKYIKNPPKGVNIDVISPGKLYVNKFTRKRGDIISGIEQGKRDAEDYIAS